MRSTSEEEALELFFAVDGFEDGITGRGGGRYNLAILLTYTFAEEVDNNALSSGVFDICSQLSIKSHQTYVSRLIVF